MRHAARDFEHDRLTSEGLKSAANLPRILEKMRLPHPLSLESSPKVRTQTTLRFLAEEIGLRTVVNRNLDERQSGESSNTFQRRVETYLEQITQLAQHTEEMNPKTTTTGVWLACSHFDWLEVAALGLSSDENDFERSELWSPMAIRAYVFHNGLWMRKR